MRMNSPTLLAMAPTCTNSSTSWGSGAGDCLDPYSNNYHPSSTVKDEELRRYFHRVDAILNELRTNYYYEEDTTEEDDDMSIPTVSMLSVDSCSTSTSNNMLHSIVRPIPQRTSTATTSSTSSVSSHSTQRRRRGSRSRRYYNDNSINNSIHNYVDHSTTPLINLVAYLEDLRADGARNPFAEEADDDEETMTILSKDTEQFLRTHGVVMASKPVAVRARDATTTYCQ